MRGVVQFSPACWWRGGLCPVILAGSLGLCAQGATITVTTTADSGAGSFRQALSTANTNPGPDTIVFQITGTAPFSITPTNALPAITDPVVIDATTQPGFAGKPVVELNGAATSGGTIGLRFSLNSDGSTLRGLAINRFAAQAVELDSPSNVIQSNFIGTDVTGMVQKDNGAYGILVKSVGNLIGGTNAGDGNVISAGANANSAGIYVLNGTNNVVQGNLIGVNAAGTAAFSSVNNGIILYGSGANLIGGPTPAARNVISGNGASGIYLTGATAAGNVIQGNYIGTDLSGSNAVGNVAGDGISVISAPGNVICSNLISGNGLAGISIQGASAAGNQVLGNFIGTDVNGRRALGNHNSGITIFSSAGGTVIGGTNAGAGNVISGNTLDGITLTGNSATNLIQGNFLGLSAAGTNAVRNGQDGITISGGTSNTIGGVIASARNVISGNASNGVNIILLADSGNQLLGNFIGTDLTGSRAVSNGLAGVLLEGSSNLIGAAVAGAGNVISGNGQQGIAVLGVNGSVKGEAIQGNVIGLDVSGANPLGNGDAGVGISSAAGNLIGGSTAAARNVISANGGEGIFVEYTGASSNVIQGNYIGTDATGTAGRGNTYEGITILVGGGNQIGGTAGGAGNLISANGARNLNGGIYVGDSGGNVFQGNFFGTAADGITALGNFGHNIDLQPGATNNLIGGTSAGAGNRLAYAQGIYCGVRVRDGAYNNLISGNAIFGNGTLGIDLGTFGVTANTGCESGMTSAQANYGQNYPTLSNVYSGAITRIRGSLNSKVNQTYTLQFFASPSGDSSGYGEGQVFLGQTNLALGSSCSANFTVYLPAAVPPGWVVSATATDPRNNTSEFSGWVSAVPLPPVQLALPGNRQLALSWTNNGGSFALQQTFSLAPPVTWLPVTNLPVLKTNFMVTTLGLTNSSVFYRLIAP